MSLTTSVDHPVVRNKAHIPPTMALGVESTTKSKGSEEARIRDAYERRQRGKHDFDSFFNPSLVLSVQERESKLLSMLSQCGVGSLDEKKVLEIGCGTGHWLRAFLQWGALPENVFGIDLLPGRIEQARKMCPQGVHLQCGSAETTGFPDASFDLVLQSTVFTSILDPGMKQRVAAEMLRVVRPDGFVIWYDFHVNNPRNPDVRGVRKNEIRQLFPGCDIHLRRVTLAPPIGRFVGRYSPFMYMLLSRTRILCTHYLSLIKKK